MVRVFRQICTRLPQGRLGQGEGPDAVDETVDPENGLSIVADAAPFGLVRQVAHPLRDGVEPQRAEDLFQGTVGIELDEQSAFQQDVDEPIGFRRVAAGSDHIAVQGGPVDLVAGMPVGIPERDAPHHELLGGQRLVLAAQADLETLRDGVGQGGVAEGGAKVETDGDDDGGHAGPFRSRGLACAPLRLRSPAASTSLDYTTAS